MFESTKAILPELILVITTFYLTLRSASGRAKRGSLYIEALIGAICALVCLFLFSEKYYGFKAFYSTIELDKTAFFFRMIFISLAIFVIVMTAKSTEISDYLFGENLVLVFSITTGMCFVASSIDLLMIYFSLEWISLSSYLLTGFIAHKRSSSEAGMKYTLFGGIASAVMLFGMSWLFGVTGTLKLDEIPAAFAASHSIMMMFSLVLILVGFAFKVAAVPLHFWVPDVYQAASTPITTLFSIGPKAAGFAVLIRVFYYSFYNSEETALLMESLKPGLEIVFQFFAAFTMTAGNLLALRQENIKRMLAYSSISHAGFLLMGVAAMSDKGIQALYFYIFIYLLMNGGAFFVVNLIINRWGAENISDYEGLGWRGGSQSMIAVAMSVFLFSLAGLPPFGGFIGKWFIFAAAVEKHMYALVVVGLVNIVIALYYYARILRAMYLVQTVSPRTEIRLKINEGFFMGALSLSLIYYGIFFPPFMGYLKTIIP
ncbi:MAG: NADH-quinone oxidoreductase subunit N [Spirochaetia bacterium]|nr:NADH-quinone oxidoreductase subunit N [Spirochaetia bacterium]